MNRSNFEIRKYVAPEILFGKDVRLLAGQYLYNFGIEKVLIVSDNTVSEQTWFNDIIEELDARGIESVMYKSVSPNPLEREVMEGADIYCSNHCTGILAIGGGSPMDCAKGIGIVSSSHKDILLFEGIDKVEIPGPPIVCIPTTSGTSADVSQFSIIRDMKRLVKIAIVSKALVPDVALIDPVASSSMGSYLTACTGIDALTHAVEAFVSNANSPVTDNHALNAMKLIKENLHKAIKNPEDITSRYNMTVASLEAGLAFSNASLGAVHAMAHSLGGYYDLAHGECNALLLSHVMDFNFSKEPERFNEIAKVFDLDTRGLVQKEKKKLLLEAIRSFIKSMGITTSLSERGVKTVDLPLVSLNASKDPCVITNPREVNVDDIVSIFKEAL